VRLRGGSARLGSGVEGDRWGNVSRTRRGEGPLAAGHEGGFPVGLGLDFAVVWNRGARGGRPGGQVQTLEDGTSGLGGMDDREQAHAGAAARALQYVDCEDAA